jgi:hypothetical protein
MGAVMRRARAFPPIIAAGVLVGGDPANEAEHFIKCQECGHMIDMRNLGEVLEHEGPHSGPVPT